MPTFDPEDREHLCAFLDASEQILNSSVVASGGSLGMRFDTSADGAQRSELDLFNDEPFPGGSLCRPRLRKEVAKDRAARSRRRRAAACRVNSVARRELAVAKPRRYANAFEAVGLEPLQAEHLRIRADLMIAVERLIAERQLTQAAAAKLLHVTQPRISDLMRGKIERFSIDTLVEMLGRAGVDVSVKVRRRRSAA
jgi:predicted XRE-type DNA-binding protein